MLLIIDEVQSGVGRMGVIYGYMNYDIEPDIVTSAKGLGGGIPIGATLTTKNIGECMQPGTHGSTFGGNPIACAVANEVIRIVSDSNFLKNVLEKEKLFIELLSELKTKGIFSDIRSSGLWIGCDLVDKNANDVLDQAYSEGLIMVSAGSSCLRLAPALNIPNEDIEKGVALMKKILMG